MVPCIVVNDAHKTCCSHRLYVVIYVRMSCTIVINSSIVDNHTHSHTHFSLSSFYNALTRVVASRLLIAMFPCTRCPITRNILVSKGSNNVFKFDLLLPLVNGDAWVRVVVLNELWYTIKLLLHKQAVLVVVWRDQTRPQLVSLGGYRHGQSIAPSGVNVQVSRRTCMR